MHINILIFKLVFKTKCMSEPLYVGTELFSKFQNYELTEFVRTKWHSQLFNKS